MFSIVFMADQWTKKKTCGKNTSVIEEKVPESVVTAMRGDLSMEDKRRGGRLD